MFTYTLDLTPDEDTLLITSPDFPELTSFADNEDDAPHRGRNALIAVIWSRMQHREDIPDPTPSDGRTTVFLPTLVAAKVALYRAMRAAKVSQVDLAARLECDPRQVRRLLDVTNSSRQDHIDAALAAVGKRLEVTVADAA